MASSDRIEAAAPSPRGAAPPPKLDGKSSTTVDDSTPLDAIEWTIIFFISLFIFGPKLVQVGFVLAYLITHCYEVLPNDIVSIVWAVIGCNFIGPVLFAVLMFLFLSCNWDQKMKGDRWIPVGCGIPSIVAAAVHIPLGVLLVLRTKNWQNMQNSLSEPYKFAFQISIGELLQGGISTIFAVVFTWIFTIEDLYNEEQNAANSNVKPCGLCGRVHGRPNPNACLACGRVHERTNPNPCSKCGRVHENFPSCPSCGLRQYNHDAWIGGEHVHQMVRTEPRRSQAETAEELSNLFRLNNLGVIARLTRVARGIHTDKTETTSMVATLPGYDEERRPPAYDQGTDPS